MQLPSNVQVLIVEDTHAERMIVSTMLLDLGVAGIHVAESKDDAVRRFRHPSAIRYDLILLGRYLGEGSGLEVLKAIRKHDSKVPVLVMSHEDSAEKVMEVVAEGATDYIVKPFSGENFFSKVKRIFGWQ